MKPDVYNGIAGLAADHGVEAAAEVAAFEAKHVSFLKEFIEREKIDCEYSVTKAIDVQLSRAHSATLKKAYEGLIEKGCEATTRANYIPSNEAEQVSTYLNIVWGYTNLYYLSSPESRVHRAVSHMRPVTFGHTNSCCTFWKRQLPKA